MAQNTRERLVTVGADRFYQRGFQAVGLDEILDEVGITKTAFYKHFESKDDLIVAVLEHRDQQDMTEWAAFFRDRGGDDPRQQLLAVFDLLYEWFSQPGFRGCLFMNASTEFPDRNHPIHQTAKQHGDKLQAELTRLAAAAGAADADGLSRQVMLLVTGAIAARHAGGDPEAALLGKQTAELLVGRACGDVPVAARR